MTKSKSKKSKQHKVKSLYTKLLEVFLLILLCSIFFIVVYSAMKEGNHERRVIVPEALDAPYQPYRPSMSVDNDGRVMPIDSMMRDLYVVQREINQGSHQLYLFFDTFTHRPVPLNKKNLDLKKPEDAQWYNFAVYAIVLLIVLLPTISTFLLKKRVKSKIKAFWEDKNKYQQSKTKMFLDFIKENRMIVVILVFMLAVLLSMINLSIPLEEEFEYRADPFFVFICFSSIAVTIVSVKYVLKGLKKIKIGGDTTLAGKNAFQQTLAWGALGVWAMGFMCYFIGMYSLGTQKSVLASIVRPALESSKMFVLSDNVKEISFTLRSNGAFMGFYTLCKLTFLLISSFALVSLAWSRINSFWSIRDRSRSPGDLYVFFGINENTKILAQDINGKLEQRLEKDLEKELENELKNTEIVRRLKQRLREKMLKELKEELKKERKQKQKEYEGQKSDQEHEGWAQKQEEEYQNHGSVPPQIQDLKKELKKELKKKLKQELKKELRLELRQEREQERELKDSEEELKQDQILKRKKRQEVMRKLKQIQGLRQKLNHQREQKKNKKEKLRSDLEKRLEQKLDLELYSEKRQRLDELLKKRRDYTIVMVENRNSPVEGMGSAMSISSLVGMFNFRKDAYAEVRDVSPDAFLVISNSTIASRECSEQVDNILERIKNDERVDKNERFELFNSLGLKQLSIMIRNAKNSHFFFLEDDDRANIDATDNLHKMLHIVHQLKGESTIYCLARNNVFSTLLHKVLPPENGKADKVKVKILDLSVMAAQSLFLSPENHPISFVECDTNTATVKEGERFESLVIGFGRGGRDIVRYLYEFGAFLDHKCATEGYTGPIERTPFQCTILDKNINMIKHRYLAKIPAVRKMCEENKTDAPLLFTENAALNSERFVSLIEKKLDNRNMNFVVISLGDDKTSMGALTFVVDQAMRIRKGKLGKLKIFVRNYDAKYENTMKEQADYFNQLLGKKVISIFGNRLDLLTADMVVNDKIELGAKKFYDIIKVYRNEKKNWTQRHDEGRGLMSTESDNTVKYGGLSWENQSRILRQETQDILNGMHIDTKLRLIGIVRDGRNVDQHQLELLQQLNDAIEFTDQGYRFRFKTSDPKLQLLYLNLARNEHLRKAASLEMLGYVGAKPGSLAQSDEIAKIHPCIVDWNELDAVNRFRDQQISDNTINFKTLDYLMVKSSLELANKELEQLYEEQKQNASNESTDIDDPDDDLDDFDEEEP